MAVAALRNCDALGRHAFCQLLRKAQAEGTHTLRRHTNAGSRMRGLHHRIAVLLLRTPCGRHQLAHHLAEPTAPALPACKNLARPEEGERRLPACGSRGIGRVFPPYPVYWTAFPSRNTPFGTNFADKGFIGKPFLLSTEEQYRLRNGGSDRLGHAHPSRRVRQNQNATAPLADTDTLLI